jgi:hypothetical protein
MAAMTRGGPAQRFVEAALLVSLAGTLAACSHLVDRSNAGIVSLEQDTGSVGTISRTAKYAGWAASAPLVAAMTPVAALAWATPWVDLLEAVDIASAPAIALGYALEAVVGFAARAVATMVRTVAASESPRPPEPGAPLRPFVPWGFVVQHLEARTPVRSGEEIPEDIRQYYEVDSDLVGRLRAALSPRLRQARTADGPIRVEVPTASFAATLELYPARGASPANPRPLVLLTPPTEAAFAGRWLAARFARRGSHGVVVVPEKPFLEPSLTPDGLEAKLREAVVASRMTLRAVGEMEDVAADQLYYLGVSAGGIFGGVLLAVEPSIRRGVLVLSGGDIPRIIAESEEKSVVAYRRAWTARGVDPPALRRELAGALRTDPLSLARFVDPHRLLLFLGVGDTVVPVATGLELRAALGDPETYLLAGNHDTASVCFGFILRRGERFLLEGR